MRDLEWIDADLTVNETIRRFPATLPVFKEFGIDTCCGGASHLTEAAERKGVDPVALLDAVRAPAEAPARHSRCPKWPHIVSSESAGCVLPELR